MFTTIIDYPYCRHTDYLHSSQTRPAKSGCILTTLYTEVITVTKLWM